MTNHTRSAGRDGAAIPPWKVAGKIDKFTETLFKALSGRVAKRWRFVSFRGDHGGEWRGIVDVVAIRKDTSDPRYPPLKRGDLFEIILVQMKGGSARKPRAKDIKRLQQVKKHYGAKEIVLFNWKKGVCAHFSRLRNGMWKLSSAAEIFG